jgi:hypothetical protein
MHVVVQHRITDPESFFSGSAEEVVQNAPPGVHGRQFLVSQDRSAAVCLWEAGSVDDLKGYMEPLTGEAAENTYFEVNKEYTMGLPEEAGASAQ